jgi:metal-responsive CopG/Arc/MetJ family transcriptional regulator
MRVQVNLSKEMIDRVDKIANYYGVTRSGLLAIFIGDQVREEEKYLPSSEITSKA